MPRHAIPYIVLIFLLPFHTNPQLFGQVNTEKMRNNEAERGFQHTVGFGLGLLAGNSDQYKVSGNYRLDWLSARYYSFLIVNYERGKSGGEIFSDKGFVHTRITRDLSERWIAEIFGQREFNKMISLKDRQLAGGGMRYEIRRIGNTETDQKSKFVLGLGTGLMYEREITSSPKDNRTLVRSTSYASIHRQLDDRISFITSTYFQAALKHRSDFRILDESMLTVSLTKSFAFTASFIFRYDHEPPPDVKRYDVSLTNGIHVRF